MNFNSEKEIDKIIINLHEISIMAGRSIMNIYNSEYKKEIKKDGSPLTEADNKSNEIIIKNLKKINPLIPIISEEDSDISFSVRSKWDTYWLIDPLDGTKEFINKNGEFTTNIALIKNNKPIIGIVHSPTTQETYWGSRMLGSYHIDVNEKIRKLDANKINNNNICRVVVSRSHKSQKIKEFLKQIGESTCIESGSSIKFCMIADNKADIYPRFSPTSEWDTAAGQAVAIFSNAKVNLSNGILEYNKKVSYLNESFLVSNKKYHKYLTIFRKIEER
jgi:3'(2'), 5'-bisphosphate nucleotidase